MSTHHEPIITYYITIQSASDVLRWNIFADDIFDENNEKLPDPTGSNRTIVFLVQLEDEIVFVSRASQVSYLGTGRAPQFVGELNARSRV